MSDRINFLTVVLDKDYRDDDVVKIVEAISMVKGVMKIKENVATPEEYMAIVRAKSKIADKLWKVLDDCEETN